MKKIIASLVIGFLSGWTINGWRYSSLELKQANLIVQLRQEKEAIAQKNGQKLEEILAQQRKNDAEFDEKLNKAIQISPDTVCFNDDFIGLFNDKINRSKTVLSGKLAR